MANARHRMAPLFFLLVLLLSACGRTGPQEPVARRDLTASSPSSTGEFHNAFLEECFTVPELFEPGGLMPGLEKAFIAFGEKQGLTREQGRETFALTAAAIDTLILAGGNPFSTKLDDQLQLMELAAGRGIISEREAETLGRWARQVDAAKSPGELKDLLFGSMPAEADSRILLEAIDIGQHSYEFWTTQKPYPYGEGGVTQEEALAQLAADVELMQAMLQADMYGGVVSGAAAGFLLSLTGPVGIGGHIFIGAIQGAGGGVCSLMASMTGSGSSSMDGWGVGWGGEGHCH